MYTRILLVLFLTLFTMGCAGNSLIRGGDVVEIKDFAEVDKKFVKTPAGEQEKAGEIGTGSLKTKPAGQGLLLGADLGYWGLRAFGLPGSASIIPLSDPAMGFFLVQDLLIMSAPKSAVTTTITTPEETELIRVVDGKLSKLLTYQGISEEDKKTLDECKWRFVLCEIGKPFTIYKIDEKNYSCVGRQIKICLVNPEGKRASLKAGNSKCSLGASMGIIMRSMGQGKLPQK